MICHKHLI